MVRQKRKPLVDVSTLAVALAAVLMMLLADRFRYNFMYWLVGTLVGWLILSMVLRLFGLRITFAGVVFAGITAFVTMAAHTSQSNLLFWALGLMLGGLIMSGMLCWMMLRKIEVRRVVEGSAVAGLPATVHYVLTNKKRRWPTLAVQIRETGYTGSLLTPPDGYCLFVAAQSSQTMMTQMIAGRRGTLKLADIVISCGFPFGFLEYAIRFSSPRDVVVYPRVGLLSTRLAMLYRQAITGGSMTSSLRGGGDEFYGLREYRPGDSIRAISWKRTAHTGQIVVREMTSNAPPQMMVVLDIRHWRELPEAIGGEQVEKAIELAGSLLCYGSMENFAIGLTIAGLPEQAPATTYTGREARSRMLSALATLDPRNIEMISPIGGHSRIARRPEFIIVTLRGNDPLDDLVPMGASKTIMAMDNPEADTWLRFVGGLEAIRIMRDEAATAPSHPPRVTLTETAPAAAPPGPPS